MFHSVRSYYHSSSTIFCYLPPLSLRGRRAKDGRSRTNMRLYYCCCLLLLWFCSVRSFYLHLLHWTPHSESKREIICCCCCCYVFIPSSALSVILPVSSFLASSSTIDRGKKAKLGPSRARPSE